MSWASTRGSLSSVDARAFARKRYHEARLWFEALRPHRRPTIIVWGNCQAEAIRLILGGTASVSRHFRVLRFPAAHLVTRAQLWPVRRLFRTSDVVIAQLIRDGYRDLPIGTRELSRGSRGRVITFPVMFYRGLHPFLVYVHADGQLGTPAPLTEGYHDARIIAAAGARMDADVALRFFESWAPSPAFLSDVASRSAAELARREAELDVAVSPVIAQLGETAFWTLNHPSNAVLAEAAEQIMGHLGLEPKPAVPRAELLVDVVVPPARASVAGHAEVWRIGQRSVPFADVVMEHLRFYREHPRVLEVALAEHSALLETSGLTSAAAGHEAERPGHG